MQNEVSQTGDCESSDDDPWGDGAVIPPPPRAHGASLREVPGYEILERLASGGFGVVYRARRIETNTIVALKTMHASHGGDSEVCRRFRNEVEAVQRLDHANIVELHDFGEVDGTPFFTMEYAPAGNLHGLLGEPWEPREAARLIRTLARALHHAHERGIVHRDVKPRNVLVTADGTFKLGDFGLAKFDDPGRSRHTIGIHGTPGYIAPEQILGPADRIGPGADVFSLGVVLYELLTTQLPFGGAEGSDVLREIVYAEPPPLAAHARASSRELPALQKICLACLRKEPRERYRTAAALADDLDRFLDGRSVHGVRRGPVARLRHAARHRPRQLALLACLSFALVGVFARLAYWAAFVMPVHEFYVDTEFRDGRLTGLQRVDETFARHRNRTFRIERRGWFGNAAVVSAVTGDGLPCTNGGLVPFVIGHRAQSVQYEVELVMSEIGDPVFSTASRPYVLATAGFARVELGYDGRGQLESERYFHHGGDEGLLTFVRDSEDSSCERIVEFRRDGGRLIASPTGLTSACVRYRDGRYGDISFRSPLGAPCPDLDGAYGLRFEYDRNRMGAVIALDRYGRPVETSRGHSHQRVRHDAAGNIVRISFWTLADDGRTLSPATNEGLVHAIANEFDDDGRQVSAAFLEIDADEPFARVGYEYDAECRLLRETTTIGNEPLSTIEYDYRRFPEIAEFLRQGNTTCVSRYDARCRLVERTIDGGRARMKLSYGELGLETVRTWNDSDLVTAVVMFDENDGSLTRAQVFDGQPAPDRLNRTIDFDFENGLLSSITRTAAVTTREVFEYEHGLRTTTRTERLIEGNWRPVD